MKIFLLIVFIGGAAALLLFGNTPQRRGLHGNIFVSNGRPALAVQPQAGLRLLEQGWCDVQPDSRVSTPGGAKVWYALYEGNAPQRRLLVLLTETGDGWKWPHGLPGEHHQWARRVKHDINGLMAHQGAYVLTPKDDPWSAHDTGPWTAGSFAQRYVFLTQFNKVKLVIEYREPVAPATPRPLLEDVDALLGLKDRADAAFTLLRRDSGDTIPAAEIQRLDKAPSSLSRRSLARWLGEVQREGNME